jgi:hypothetical protein
MSSAIEGIGQKFLLKLYEKTVNDGVEAIDRYEIGKELRLIDEQTDHLVNVLLAFGYIKNVGGNNIELSAEGRKKTEV